MLDIQGRWTGRDAADASHERAGACRHALSPDYPATSSNVMQIEARPCPCRARSRVNGRMASAKGLRPVPDLARNCNQVAAEASKIVMDMWPLARRAGHMAAHEVRSLRPICGRRSDLG